MRRHSKQKKQISNKKLLAVGGFFLCCALGLFCFFSPLPEQNTSSALIFSDQKGAILYQTQAVPASADIPQEFKGILLAIEDQRFFLHHGIDARSILRATGQNLQARKIISGASTVTMQLARIQYLAEKPRTFEYKLLQAWYALKLEHAYTKDEILDRYIQQVSFGASTRGLEEAARRYFSKEPTTLNTGEMALLVGILPRPESWSPLNHPDQAILRRNHVLTQLQTRGLLSEEKANFWQQQPLTLRPWIGNEIVAPHFVFWVEEQLTPWLKKHPAQEINIHTTLDKNLYQQALTIARKEVELRHEKNIQNSTLVALDNDQHTLKLMVGSIDFFDADIHGAINMATAPRQTGSVLKPFLYALMIEQGFHPAREIRDERTVYRTPQGQYIPRNFHAEEEYGAIRPREALANSYNIAAVRLLSELGLQPFEVFLARFGLHSPTAFEDMGLGVVLGGSEFDLLSVTQAYQVFANEGVWTPVQFFTHITDENGNVLLTWDDWNRENTHSVLAPHIADWVTHTLSDHTARLKEFSAGNVLELEFDTAAKTGTTQEFRDNWVIGYSPQYSVGVWVGNANQSSLHTVSGVEGAGPIWNKTLRLLHANLPKENFRYTSDRAEVALCRRPYQTPPCAEMVTEFLTTEEQRTLPVSAPPTLAIAFPADGTHFHAQSRIAFASRYSSDPQKDRFFLNGDPTDPVRNHLSPGQYRLEVRNETTQSDPIFFWVDP